MFLVLWEMALIRLIIPFHVSSTFSIFTFVSRALSTPVALLNTETDNVTAAILQKQPVIVQGMEQVSADSASFPVWDNPNYEECQMYILTRF